MSMNKPSWDDAPEWANFLVQDEDLTWWWFSEEPYSDDGEWRATEGMATRAHAYNDEWRTQIEHRPCKP